MADGIAQILRLDHNPPPPFVYLAELHTAQELHSVLGCPKTRIRGRKEDLTVASSRPSYDGCSRSHLFPTAQVQPQKMQPMMPYATCIADFATVSVMRCRRWGWFVGSSQLDGLYKAPDERTGLGIEKIMWTTLLASATCLVQRTRQALRPDEAEMQMQPLTPVMYSGMVYFLLCSATPS